MTNSVETRRNRIADIVSRNGFSNVLDLAETLSVTPATIRTDLRALEERGLVKRSHGGALMVSREVTDLPEDVKGRINVGLKKRIAAKAVQLIENNDTIIIASGSTMVSFAENIIPEGKLNVVTPSIRIAMKLLGNDDISVLQLGGRIYGNTLSTRGEYAESGLELLHCTKLFFGVEGFDMTSGLTCATLEEAALTRKMMQSATKSIVLADSTKFCRRGFGRICRLSAIDMLITDDGLPQEAIRQIEDDGVQVIIAD